MHYEKIHYPDNEKVWMECYIQDSGLKLGQEQMSGLQPGLKDHA